MLTLKKLSFIVGDKDHVAASTSPPNCNNSNTIYSSVADISSNITTLVETVHEKSNSKVIENGKFRLRLIIVLQRAHC